MREASRNLLPCDRAKENARHFSLCTDDKKGNIPFGKVDLAAIVLVSVPMMRQNQYNFNHTMVPQSTRALLPDLEAIEQVMVEKQQEKLKAKGKAATARPEAKSNPKRKASESRAG